MLTKLKHLLNNSASIKAEVDVLKSQWQNEEKSVVYMAYRWLVFFFFAFVVLFSAIENIECGHFHVYFIYLTHLNLCGTAATLCLGAVLVTLFRFNKFSLEKNNLELRLYWLLWNQSIVFSCMITVFYWLVIYEGQAINVNNVLIHITNSTILIFDLLIVKHPPNYKAVIFLLPVEVSYLVFTVLYQLLGGLDKNGENFVYSASDWINHPYRALFFFCCFATLSIILHFIINFVHTVRCELHNRFSLNKVEKVDVRLEDVV